MLKKYHCIKQKELKDCGPACLATIFKQYKLKVPIYKIRELAQTDKQGTSAKALIEVANKLGFSTKGFKANNINDIYRDVPLPAIAHVIINNSYHHYVVIHKITNRYILIADPAR